MKRVVLSNDMGEVGVPAAVEVLEQGGCALDAVEAGIRIVEADAKVRWVGRGGDPNLLGTIQCDAAIMNGADRTAGAVGSLTGYLHAIRVARRVMERLPHVMLVGAGADRFAAECGEESADLSTPEAEARYRAWIERHVPDELRGRLADAPLAELTWPSAMPDHAKGTTVFLVRDGAGHLAGGTSSSGWAYKYPGRLGDSPIIGAGLYVHDEHGACGCTHTGEMTIRAGTAISVIRYLQKGASVEEACREAVGDLRSLAGGYLGPVVIHALDREGNPHVTGTTPADEPPTYRTWSDDAGEIRCCTARPARDRNEA